MMSERNEQCCKCGKPLTADDPVTTTLGPRCGECFKGRSR